MHAHLGIPEALLMPMEALRAPLGRNSCYCLRCLIDNWAAHISPWPKVKVYIILVDINTFISTDMLQVKDKITYVVSPTHEVPGLHLQRASTSVVGHNGYNLPGQC